MSGDAGHQNSGKRDHRSLAVSGAVSPARVVLVLSVAAVVVAVTWLFYAVKRPRSSSKLYRSGRLLTVERPFPAEGRFTGDPYIGGKVCAECHPAEAALHSRSGHSSTLWPAGRRHAFPSPGRDNRRGP